MVREINQALRKRIPPSWVNLTTKSFGYIWLKSEKCPKITNSYIKSNIFAPSSLVIGPNMIWKSQTKPKTNILLTPLLNAFWKYSVRFKESKLFSEQQKRIGVFYLKSCRPSIFSLICERESDQNNRITGKITKISAGICRKWFSDWEKKPFHPFSLLLSRWHFNGKILLIFCEFLRPILAWQEQRKWCLVFFHQEGHSALLQKNYQTKPCQFGIYTKSFSYLVQWVSEILIYKVSQL